MNVNINNPLIRIILNYIQKYNHKKYWEMRSEVINPNSKKSKLLRCYYLLKIKKMDAYHNASTGTDFGQGAQFATPPHLAHGLNGIFIGHNATFGKNVTIYQQVTVMQGEEGHGTVIGDNVFLGAGSKIIGGVKIGNNAVIGANAVVTKDIPENAIAVGVPAKVIKIKETTQEAN